MNFIGTLFFEVLGWAFEGWVLTVVWNWHISTFFGLPNLSLAVGMGLLLAGALFTFDPAKIVAQYEAGKLPGYDRTKEFLKRQGSKAAHSVICLALGWGLYLAR